MLKVNIWNFRGKRQAWGHASLQVGETYISWWPEMPGQVPSKIHPNIYASHPFRNRTYADDVADEGQPPDHVILIEGLNENAIKDWWHSKGLVRNGIELSGPLLPWDTLSKNCSTMVAEALRIGGGDKFAEWSKTWNMIWKPSDVLNYALSITKGLSRS